MNSEAAPVCRCNCGSSNAMMSSSSVPVVEQPPPPPPPPPADMAPPSPIRWSQDDQSTSQYSAITGHHEEKSAAASDTFFDQSVELSIGGNSIPEEEIAKVESFTDLSLISQVASNVARAGYKKPTPIQKYAMRSIQAGVDLMACSQTGSGKTAAYLLPIMNKLLWDADLSLITDGPCKPQALILAPTRELAIQIHAEAKKFAAGTLCKCEIAYGGTAFYHQKKRVEKGVIILVGTTGRIKHFIDEGVVSLEQTQFLVLDEADRMLDLGFADDVREIMEKGKMPKNREEKAEEGKKEEKAEEEEEEEKREEAKKIKRQTLLFSATFPRAVQTLAAELLRPDYLKIVVDKVGAASKCITQEFVCVERRHKKAKLLEMVGVDLKRAEQSKELEIFKKKTLIFVASKTMADTLGVFLSETGIPTTTTHGDREQAQREEALADFRNGKTPILIATAVAERGLDISGVDHVINFDMPKEINDYIHRVGRTGRLGKAGHSTSFIDAENDYGIIHALIRQLEKAEQHVPDWLPPLNIGRYCDSADSADQSYNGTENGGDFGMNDSRGAETFGWDVTAVVVNAGWDDFKTDADWEDDAKTLAGSEVNAESASEFNLDSVSQAGTQAGFYEDEDAVWGGDVLPSVLWGGVGSF